MIPSSLANNRLHRLLPTLLTNSRSLPIRSKHSVFTIKVRSQDPSGITLLRASLPFSAREAATRKSSVSRPALVWDPHLAELARQWAQHLAAGNKGLKHSTHEERRGQGENLSCMSGEGSLSGASQGWVNESAAYHGQKFSIGTRAEYGHYTTVCINNSGK